MSTGVLIPLGDKPIQAQVDGYETIWGYGNRSSEASLKLIYGSIPGMIIQLGAERLLNKTAYKQFTLII